MAHAKMWEKICYFGVFPVLGISSYLIWQHEQAHHEPPPEYVEYEHMRIRKKVWMGQLLKILSK